MVVSLPVKLRALRAARGWTLGQAAEAVGINPDNLSKLERGQRNPRVGTLARIADAYGVAVEELLSLEEEPAVAGKGEALETGRSAKAPDTERDPWRQVLMETLGVDVDEISLDTRAEREMFAKGIQELIEENERLRRAVAERAPRNQASESVAVAREDEWWGRTLKDVWGADIDESSITDVRVQRAAFAHVLSKITAEYERQKSELSEAREELARVREKA